MGLHGFALKVQNQTAKARTHACNKSKVYPAPLHIHMHAYTRTHAHTHKAKAKCLATTRVTRTWRSQGTCAPSRYCVPVLRSLLEPGKELAGAPTVSLQVWAPKVPPTPLVTTNETQPVYFAPHQVPILQTGGLEYL